MQEKVFLIFFADGKARQREFEAKKRAQQSMQAKFFACLLSDFLVRDQNNNLDSMCVKPKNWPLCMNMNIASSVGQMFLFSVGSRVALCITFGCVLLLQEPKFLGINLRAIVDLLGR